MVGTVAFTSLKLLRPSCFRSLLQCQLVAFKEVEHKRCIYIYYTIYRIILINIYKLLSLDCSLNLVRFINFEGIYVYFLT
jgi:hypothetical protein